jgi:hypothetical protein
MEVGRSKASIVSAAEAVTALRAMLAEPELFEDAIFRRLMLRATRPIADGEKRLKLYERLMSCRAGMLLSDCVATFPDRAELLREAHEMLDAIEEAGRDDRDGPAGDRYSETES